MNVTTATDKQGSTLVRWAAVEAVQKTPADAGWLVARRYQLAARRGAHIATVAAARKLLVLVYYALRDGHVRALSPRPRPASALSSAAAVAAPASAGTGVIECAVVPQV